MLQKRLFETFKSSLQGKKELKEQKMRLQDALAQNEDYQRNEGRIRELKRENNAIKLGVCRNENIDFEVLTNNINNDLELVSEIGVGELCEINGISRKDFKLPEGFDLEGERYEPVIRVKFEKKKEI